MSVPARKRPTSPSSALILMSTRSSSARARGSDAQRVVCQPVQYISFDPLWHRCAGRAWHRCRRGPSAGIAHGLDYLADRLDHQVRLVLLQKVIPFQNLDEARVEHLSLFLLQLLPQVLECRIGWSARRTVETGGEHDSRQLRRRVSHHPDSTGDDVEMFG